MIRHRIAMLLLLMLAACGGGGGGGGGDSKTPPAAKALTNFATITVDSGPAALASGSDAYSDVNLAFVSVTLCKPGTSTCQTIDHVEVDTGSVGLRIARDALDPAMLSALPNEKDAAANPVGECYGYVDGYAFGSVRLADFQIGGEKVANMPLQLVGDTGRFATVPQDCSSGGGTKLDSVKALGANGIIGIGSTTTDCGSYCAGGSGGAAANYYDCPSSGCGAAITRASTAAAPFQQLPNPVAAMDVDNNGTILSLPAAANGGAASLTGMLYFGIGTQTNNGLGKATVLTTDDDGLLDARYKGADLPNSFVDSGSNGYFFSDSAIALCSDSGFAGFYCPASSVTLSPTLTGRNAVTASASFLLQNAKRLVDSGDPVLPGLGGDPTTDDTLMPYPDSFDFGLPFFYGRKIYTAIAARAAGGTTGPYIAF